MLRLSANAIAAAITRITNKPTTYELLQENAKIQLQKFSWDNTADALWRSIEKVISEK